MGDACRPYKTLQAVHLRIALSDPRVVRAPTEYHVLPTSGELRLRSRQTFRKSAALRLRSWRKAIIGLVKLGGVRLTLDSAIVVRQLVCQWGRPELQLLRSMMHSWSSRSVKLCWRPSHEAWRCSAPEDDSSRRLYCSVVGPRTRDRVAGWLIACILLVQLRCKICELGSHLLVESERNSGIWLRLMFITCDFVMKLTRYFLA
jgi:hypothetical protein